MGINTYSKKIEPLIEFMEWYFQPEQQKRYGAVCQTGLKAVLEDPEWKNLNSYNASFADALPYTNDYWHLPEYAVLLDQLQEEVSNAISGAKTVQQALDDAAEPPRADAAARGLRDQARRLRARGAGSADHAVRNRQDRARHLQLSHAVEAVVPEWAAASSGSRR